MKKPSIKDSRRKNVLLLIGCLVFVAAGIWMVIKGSWFGWAAVLFFGSAIPFFVWQIADSRPGPVTGGRGAAGRAAGGRMMTSADGEPAAFTIDVDETDESTTEAARNTIKFLRANEPLIRLKIAASMTRLYEDWHDGEAITPEELARMIALHSVAIWEEGGGELFYTADDLFGGHWICALIDANGEIGEPELEG